MSPPIATLLQQYRIVAPIAGYSVVMAATAHRSGDPRGVRCDLGRSPGGDRPALDRLRPLPDAANAGLARAVAKLGIDLQSNVQQDKLSGEVLKVRSGALKSSITLADRSERLRQSPRRS